MKTIRILGVFFALLLCLMPTTALAADGADTTYPLWVGGEQVTSANQGDILKDGGTVKFGQGWKEHPDAHQREYHGHKHHQAQRQRHL